MANKCNATEINIKINGYVDIAPIHSHMVLEQVSIILKAMAELERVAAKSEMKNSIVLNYYPVSEMDKPIRGSE
jgi:hypothetical protein